MRVYVRARGYRGGAGGHAPARMCARAHARVRANVSARVRALHAHLPVRAAGEGLVVGHGAAGGAGARGDAVVAEAAREGEQPVVHEHRARREDLIIQIIFYINESRDIYIHIYI